VESPIRGGTPPSTHSPVPTPDAPNTETPASKSVPQTPPAGAAPGIGKLRSLKSLEQDFRARQQDEADRELTVEEVQAAIQIFVQGVESPSLRQFLQEAEVALEGERLRLIVGTQMAKGMIQQESSLMPALREALGHPGLGMRIEVDSSKAPQRDEEPGGPSTPREIFEHLATKNPLLLELHKRFDLSVE
jgi:hypothetical protein